MILPLLWPVRPEAITKLFVIFEFEILGKSWERWDHEFEPSSSFHSHQLKKDSKTIILIFCSRWFRVSAGT